LEGEENPYRIRIGGYRVIYAIFDGRLIVLVLRIGKRGDIYRKK
jgi:mRNA interferase RelE/StbE